MAHQHNQSCQRLPRLVALLVAQPLWDCTFAVDMACFWFGAKRHVQTRRGVKEVAEYSLHVQCPWRIIRGDSIIVASQDLYIPADKEEWEPDFDWQKEPNRAKFLLNSLFKNGAQPFITQCVMLDARGSLYIFLEHELCLEVLPMDSSIDEHWRLLKPGTDELHFVDSVWRQYERLKDW